MQKLKKIFHNLKYVMLLFFLNLVFFYFYARGLSLEPTLITAGFIFLFSFNFIACYYIFRSAFLRFILTFFYFVLIVFSLANYAYFLVFNTFLRFDLSRIEAVNTPLLKLLKDFYYLVPLKIYLLALGLLILSILVLFGYSRSMKLVKKEWRLSDSVDFLQIRKESRSVHVLVFIIILFAVDFSLGYYLLSFRDRAADWEISKKSYYSNIGFHGYVFYQLGDNLKSVVNKLSPAPSLAHIDEQKNIFDNIYDNLNDFETLSNFYEDSKDIKLNRRYDRPHIIFYQLESVGAWALKQNPSPMPFFSKLVNNNLSVDDFYSNSCTTNNAEFSALCSFYSESFGPISDLYSDNDYYCLPSVLKEKFGYSTSMFHANEPEFWNRKTLAPKWGIDNMHFTPEYPIRLLDADVLKDMVGKMKKSVSPTFNYFISFTTHPPHNQQFVDFYNYNSKLQMVPYSSPLNYGNGVIADEDTIRKYFAFLSLEDDSIKTLFQELKTNNLDNNTIVVFYTDHRYYNFAGNDELKKFYDYNRLPFTIYLPEKFQGQAKSIASQVDIAPTIMNILEGDNFELPKSWLGHSILSVDHPNSAINKCLGEITFISRDIIISKDLVTDVFRTVANPNEFSKFKEDYYKKDIDNFITLTDDVLEGNLLGKDSWENIVLTARSKTKTKVDLTQLTDADRDGLSDLREKAMGTNVTDADTDDDGYLDGVEVANDYDPLGPGKIKSKE